MPHFWHLFSVRPRLQLRFRSLRPIIIWVHLSAHRGEK
jgi:hypothetical protein